MASPSSLAEQAAGLKGKIAVDNAKLAYQAFKEVFTSERFKALQENGANVNDLCGLQPAPRIKPTRLHCMLTT